MSTGKHWQTIGLRRTFAHRVAVVGSCEKRAVRRSARDKRANRLLWTGSVLSQRFPGRGLSTTQDLETGH